MFKVEAHLNGADLTTITHQASEALILDTAAELRKCSEPIPDREGLGRWALSIPFVDWLALRRKYPELASADPQIRSRAYLRFMASPESMPFRVRARI